MAHAVRSAAVWEIRPVMEGLRETKQAHATVLTRLERSHPTAPDYRERYDRFRELEEQRAPLLARQEELSELQDALRLTASNALQVDGKRLLNAQAAKDMDAWAPAFVSHIAGEEAA